MDDYNDYVEFIDYVNEENRIRKRYIRDFSDPFHFYSEEEFKRRYRFEKTVVRDAIYPLVQEQVHMNNGGLPIPHLLKILIALHFYATGSFQVEIIQKYGYPAESHEVTTEDGYVLTMHRIPYGRTNSTVRSGKQKKPVVFLQHCILCSSAVFVLTGPRKALAFILADKGYDVWMGNARGSIYSRKHANMSMSDPTYWKFSWHEMGVYDLPAELEYAMKKSGNSKLCYIGHSMGTTMMYALLSTRPEYNRKVNLFVSLSPVAYMSHMKSTVFRILYGPLAFALKRMGFVEFIPNGDVITTFNRRLCKMHATFSILCSNILFLIAGYDSHQLNKTMLPVIFGHLPAGTSISSLVHYGQSMQTGDFRMFDHGPDMNIKMYNSRIPPRYQIEKISAPSAFFHGENDWLADPMDVQRLSKRMSNLVMSYRVPLKDFNHMDFLFANDVVKLLYKKVLKAMQKYR